MQLSVVTKSMPLVDSITVTTMTAPSHLWIHFESIQVSSLLEAMETLMTTRQNNSQWTRLQCHLSSPQMKCAAVIVHNCYVVILGGLIAIGINYQYLSSTAPHNNNGEPMIGSRTQHEFDTICFWSRCDVQLHLFVVGGYIDHQ